MIELLVVISIAAILSVIAVPSIRGTLGDLRQKSAQSLLASDLNQGRGEAIKHNARVIVCARNAAGSDCSGSANWLAGWVVCIDADSDNACDAGSVNNPNPVIVRPALDASMTLSVVDAVGNAVSNIRFNANSSQGGSNTRVLLTLEGSWPGAVARSVTVAGSGSISRQ